MANIRRIQIRNTLICGLKLDLTIVQLDRVTPGPFILLILIDLLITPLLEGLLPDLRALSTFMLDPAFLLPDLTVLSTFMLDPMFHNRKFLSTFMLDPVSHINGLLDLITQFLDRMVRTTH